MSAPPRTPTAAPTAVTRVRVLDLETALADVAALHDALRVPQGAHVRDQAVRAAATGRDVTAVVVDARLGTDDADDADDADGQDSTRAVRAAALVEVSRRRTPLGSVARVRLAGHGVLDQQRLASLDEDAADRLAEGLAGLVADDLAWSIDLEQLPADDPAAAALRRRFAHSRTVTGDPAPQLDWPAERDERSWARKKARQNARRAERDADAAGLPWSVDVVRDHQALLAALPESLEVRRERELALSRVDLLADPAEAAAHHALVEALAARGVLELWRLRQDGRLVCYLLAAHDGDRVRLLDSRIRPGSEQLAPSSILFARALQDWHADPDITGVDFGRGRTPFKEKLRTRDDETEHLRLWSHGPLAGLVLWGEGTAGRARQALRSARDSSVTTRRLVDAVRRRQTARTEGGDRPG